VTAKKSTTRDLRISVPVTLQEKKELQASAKLEGRNVAAQIRWKLFGGAAK
jgi:hypothetical protein